MQRLILAAIVVVALVALLSLALAGLRRSLSGPTVPAVTEASGMQKVSFALLAALMLYVAFQGSD